VLTKRDSLAAEMQAIVRLAAEPCRLGCDNTKSLIGRAADVLGLSYRRARTFWYGSTEQVLVRDEEAARLRDERDRLLRLKEQRLERELHELRTLLHYAELRHAAALAGQRSTVAEGAVAAVPAVGAA
jgi:hypothetical protein